MQTADSPPAPLFDSLAGRAPVWLRWLLALAACVAVAGAAYAGFERHPREAPPAGADAERRITATFGIPGGADGTLMGDYLIERFYLVDENGRPYVADLCKGRVTLLNQTTRKDWIGIYTVILDRSNLKDQAPALTELMTRYAPPANEVRYLGVHVQAGAGETFNVNYDGQVPRRLQPFSEPGGRGVYAYLNAVGVNGVAQARLMPSKGTNYLLSSTQLFPYLAAEFGMGKAVFLSQVLFLDDPAQP